MQAMNASMMDPNIELMERTPQPFSKDAFAPGKRCPNCGSHGMNWMHEYPGRTCFCWCFWLSCVGLCWIPAGCGRCKDRHLYCGNCGAPVNTYPAKCWDFCH